MSTAIMIKVCSAEITREDKKFTKMDLYASLAIGKQHNETKNCRGGNANPTWNETLKFTLSKDKDINVEVWDGSFGDDVLIAEGKVIAPDMSKLGPRKSVWVNLFFEKKPAGKILLEIFPEEPEKKKEVTVKKQIPVAEPEVKNEDLGAIKQQLKALQMEVDHIKGLGGGEKSSSENFKSKMPYAEMDPLPQNTNLTMHSNIIAFHYNEAMMNPVLRQGLAEVGKLRPQFPVTWLGQFLLANDTERIEWEKNGCGSKSQEQGGSIMGIQGAGGEVQGGGGMQGEMQSMMQGPVGVGLGMGQGAMNMAKSGTGTSGKSASSKTQSKKK